MGILNVTPDSFSDGGMYMDTARASARADEIVSEGAHLIDVGGASSRPRGSTYGEGAAIVSAQQEMNRILPVIECVAASHPDVWISVDTFRSDVAGAALSVGAHMINDITALRFDPLLASVCADVGAPLVLMHSVGMPGEMPHVTEATDILKTVKKELAESVGIARNAGCKALILDPGFGFGKTVHDNLLLISRIDLLLELGWPLMFGVSRKSAVGHIAALNGTTAPAGERLAGSLGITAVGVLSGASIVRTHDVKATVEFLAALSATRNTSEF